MMNYIFFTISEISKNNGITSSFFFKKGNLKKKAFVGKIHQVPSLTEHICIIKI